MFVKERDKPLELYQLEALHRRLLPLHRLKEKVFSDLSRARAGIRGEREVDFPLKFLNEQDYLIIQGLRLPDQNGTFQIDNLILSEKYILILEIKNWYGTVIFGENGQVTRIGDNGIEEGFPNPIPQAKLQQHRLQKWLHSNGISHIPIEFFVVISFPSTMIKSVSAAFPIPDKVIHNSHLLFEIRNLDEVYQKPMIKMPQLRELAQDLIKAHTPLNTNILKKYGITAQELIKGVFCPKCSEVPMIRKREKWYCRRCHHTSKIAHFPALNDYQWLVGDYITNRAARDFLRVDSPYVVKEILKKAAISYSGENKGRSYKLDFKEKPI